MTDYSRNRIILGCRIGKRTKSPRT